MNFKIVQKCITNAIRNQLLFCIDSLMMEFADFLLKCNN